MVIQIPKNQVLETKELKKGSLLINFLKNPWNKMIYLARKIIINSELENYSILIVERNRFLSDLENVIISIIVRIPSNKL